MKTLLIVIAVAVGGLAAVALGGGLLVLLAYGVGQALNLVLHWENSFQLTLLSLIGICAAGWFTLRLVSNFVSAPFPSWNEDWDDEEDDEEDEEEEPDYYPGIPRWRQPLKRTDFSGVQPDEFCPCGSGRKYKNCHGRGSKGKGAG